MAVEHLRAAAATDVAGAKTRFHLASALEALGRREKDVDLIEEALTEYVMADLLFEGRRAEGREHLQPLAWLASTDLAVLLGRTEVARTAVERVLAKPRPEVPEVAATAWRNRVESLARAIDADPALGPALSARVRAWGRIE